MTEDSEFEHYAAHASFNQHIVRSRYPHFWIGVFLIACVLLTLGTASYWVFSRNSLRSSSVFVFLEMKVIDDDGHPVAGASILHNKKVIGTTDSYGEWRRYMKAPLGATIPLVVYKESEFEKLQVIKNIAVPLKANRGREVEIRSSVSLSKNVSAGSAQMAFANQLSEQSESEKAGAIKKDSRPTIWFTVSTNPNPTYTDTKKSETWLQQHLLPLLIKEASRRGWHVDSHAQFQVLIQHISAQKGPDFSGLLRIVGRTSAQESIDVLRNYSSDERDFVNKVFLALRSSPNFESGQREFSVRLYGVKDREISVYVGGQKARFVGNQTWQYKGQSHQNAFISLIKKETLIFRKLLRNDLKNPEVLTLPKETLATR